MQIIQRVCVIVALTATFAAAADQKLYLDPTQPVEARVEDLLQRMTLEEKVSIVHANSKFTTPAIPRLGIPLRWLSDGPNGVREDVGPDSWKPAGRTDDFATWLPAPICLAASWDSDLADAYGTVIGEEARKRGKQIMLGPSVNIQRTPLCGRNFEYLGEDPLLTSRIAVGFIQGEQSQGIASCVKHFAANNQETDRYSVNVEMDDRTLREIYLPAFKAAVQRGGVLAVMGAYNKFRGQHCTENAFLINHILKGNWGFKGLVVSDWDAAADTKEAALNGLDLEMGTDKPYDDYYLAKPFLDGLRSGKFPMSAIDEKVRRNLRVMFLTHAFDPPADVGSINTPTHQATARRVAEEGIVLLKNEKETLPLDATKISSLAVIGENAVTEFAHGGGSAAVKAFYEITPLAGIIHRAGGKMNVNFSMGYSHDRASTDMTDRAVRAAAQADVVIFVAGLNHSKFFDSEGSDRKDLSLPYGQDELIKRVIKANPKTIVVLNSGAAVDMSAWLDQTPAVLQAWYPGMEGGNALAAILFGDVNPSGKLPATIPKRLTDSPAHALGNYPGTFGTEHYEEGVLVGYRWFDAKQVQPLFPFGHGLSYTHFDYSNLKLTSGTADPLLTVRCDIANTGHRNGAEIVQLYVHPEKPSVARPDKELKGFQKIFLKSGEKKTVTIPLRPDAFAFYDSTKGGWLAEAGDYSILVGASSRDVRLQGKWMLPQTIFTEEK
jgi:beta-glucosidase